MHKKSFKTIKGVKTVAFKNSGTFWYYIVPYIYIYISKSHIYIDIYQSLRNQCPPRYLLQVLRQNFSNFITSIKTVASNPVAEHVYEFHTAKT